MRGEREKGSQPTRLGSVAAPRGRWREAPVGETEEGLGERLSLCLHVGEGGFEAQTVSGLYLELCFKTSDFSFLFFSPAHQQDFPSFLQFCIVCLH